MSDAKYRAVWTPRWWRWLGVRWVEWRRRDREDQWTEVRFSWGEMARHRKVALELVLFDDPPHYSLHLGLWFVALWIRMPLRAKRAPREMLDAWGVSWSPWDEVHLHWAHRVKIVAMPWTWGSSVAHWTLGEDGCWYDAPIGRVWRGGVLCTDDGDPWTHLSRSEREAVPPAVDSLLFREDVEYRRESGEIQKRVATVSVHRQEWRAGVARLLRLPWPRRIYRGIWVAFSDEVGESTGSWKGGTVGCGYALRPGESPGECLIRMMRERKFR